AVDGDVPEDLVRLGDEGLVVGEGQAVAGNPLAELDGVREGAGGRVGPVCRLAVGRVEVGADLGRVAGDGRVDRRAGQGGVDRLVGRGRIHLPAEGIQDQLREGVVV